MAELFLDFEQNLVDDEDVFDSLSSFGEQRARFRSMASAQNQSATLSTDRRPSSALPPAMYSQAASTTSSFVSTPQRQSTAARDFLPPHSVPLVDATRSSDSMLKRHELPAIYKGGEMWIESILKKSNSNLTTDVQRGQQLLDQHISHNFRSVFHYPLNAMQQQVRLCVRHGFTLTQQCAKVLSNRLSIQRECRRISTYIYWQNHHIRTCQYRLLAKHLYENAQFFYSQSSHIFN